MLRENEGLGYKFIGLIGFARKTKPGFAPIDARS
jgi:hypothetical protein